MSTAWKRLKPSSDRLFLLFTVVVAATCVWVLTLPLFPSQDGPLHLYYANIFGRLLAADPGRYRAYFHIGSYVPPYAAYYYALVALQRVMPLETADQVLVCCNIVLTAFGFRYLARRVGPGGEIAGFLVLPVLLNWPLMMGFLNFCLSFGFALWAAGLWARFEDGRSLWRRAWFLALVYLMAVTHPIPLAVLLVGCGLDLCLRAVLMPRQRLEAQALVARLLPRFACLVLALPACVYVQHFVVKGVLTQYEPIPLRRSFVDNAVAYLHGIGLLVYPADSAWALLYRVGVGCALLAAFLLGAKHAWCQVRARQVDAATLWMGASLALLLLFPLLPENVNGAFFVARRLVLLPYLCIALGMAGVRPGGRGWVLVVLCVVLSGSALALGAVRVGAAAKRIAMLASSSFVPPGELGVVEQVSGTHLDGLTYRPYFWGAAFYFRRHHLILYNAPWLDEPQIPLKRNRGSALLESIGDGSLPPQSEPAISFAPGGRWDPSNASFFLFEERKPPMDGRTQEMHWEAAVPVRGLDEVRCRDVDWYCIAVRPAVAGNQAPAPPGVRAPSVAVQR